jgi:succinate dehydrogenase/fumarate reductase cytochrome b subunit
MIVKHEKWEGYKDVSLYFATWTTPGLITPVPHTKRTIDMFVQITAAQIFGNFFEAVFFGLYLVTCGFCARTLLITGHGQEERWFRASEIRWIMAIVAVALFLVLTFDVAIGLLHNFNAFVKSKNAEKELLNISDWINITRVYLSYQQFSIRTQGNDT